MVIKQENLLKEILYMFFYKEDCYFNSKKFTKKNNANDHLQVFVDTKEYANWLRTEAW